MRRPVVCGRCRVRSASSGWCAVRACRRPADAEACAYGRKLVESDYKTAYFRKLRGQAEDGSGTRKYTRRAPKVQMELVDGENAAEAMTRHLRKNHGYFGAAAEVKASGQN